MLNASEIEATKTNLDQESKISNEADVLRRSEIKHRTGAEEDEDPVSTPTSQREAIPREENGEDPVIEEKGIKNKKVVR